MKHVLSVLVENRPGVLSRVTGLISRRGFNIEPASHPNCSSTVIGIPQL